MNASMKLVMLAAAVAAAGCSASSEDTSSSADEALVVMTGVDYSYARPSIEKLHQEGYRFAARYLSYDSAKNLTRHEAHELWANGIDVVANWESTATSSLGGYSQGVSDAKEALSQANAAGIPDDRPIYFSIDFDATPGQQTAINRYFDGVASVLGRERTGAYGGYWPLKRLFDDGKITWGWQTTAWSGGLWEKRAQVRQVAGDVTLAGDPACCDIDHAMTADIGQWHARHDSGATTAIVADDAGGLDAFDRAPDGSLRHIRQAKDGTWSGWENLGGNFARDVAAVKNEDGRLEVFGVATSGEVVHKWQQSPNGPWSASWHSLGGDVVGVPTVLVDADGNLEVFARGKDDDLRHARRKKDGTWTDFRTLGGNLTSSPVAVLNENDDVEVFARGDGHTLRHIWWKDRGVAWSDWHDLGGDLATDPRVVRRHDKHLEVFARGGDDAVHHVWQTPDGSWSKWESLGDKIVENVSVTLNRFDQIVVVATQPDGSVKRAFPDASGWSHWLTLDGNLTSGPSIVLNGHDRLAVFGRNASGELTYDRQRDVSGDWAGWRPLGGTID